MERLPVESVRNREGWRKTTRLLPNGQFSRLMTLDAQANIEHHGSAEGWLTHINAPDNRIAPLLKYIPLPENVRDRLLNNQPVTVGDTLSLAKLRA